MSASLRLSSAMFQQLIAPLSSDHQQALRWFRDRQGQEIDWPRPLPDGLHLVTAAKGILKPKGWRYTLSVRQALGSTYADHDPEEKSDGSWRYRYFQEGRNPAHRDRYFTNRGLIACMEDAVPVGVLRQTRPSPGPRYKVLGVALVHGWDNGYFLLRGIAPSHVEEAREGI
jgi:putative restriction endonuclease